MSPSKSWFRIATAKLTSPPRVHAALCAIWVQTLACTGDIDQRHDERGTDAPGGGADDDDQRGGSTGHDGVPNPALAPRCEPTAPALPLQALDSTQYANSVRDLLRGLSVEGIAPFVTDVGVTLAQQQQQTAERIAERASADVTKLMGCDPAPGDSVCPRSFITAFVGRAFRRPVEPEEVESYLGLYESGRASADARSGAALVVQAALQSPHFLYRPEVGIPLTDDPSVLRLTPHEIASRLAYLITDTMPDDELLRAAAEGGLDTQGDVTRHARRLLADEAAHEMVARFHEHWLGFGEVANGLERSSQAPAYEPALLAVMQGETERFLEHVFFESNLETLFTADYSFMPPALAALYGAERAAGTGFERVSLNARQRAGVLTHASLLAVNAQYSEPHPVLRGKLVRTRFLCEALPDAPADLLIEAPEIVAGQSTRERWRQHSEEPGCAACHELMDPIGFAFDNYDAVGAWRDEEHGRPIDATGFIAGDSDAAGAFAGVVALGKTLANSHTAQRCLATQWFRFSFNRLEDDDDACTLSHMTHELATAGGSPLEMVVALTASPAFINRRANP